MNTLFKDVGMTDESQDEDEVVTKKKVSKATPKKAKKVPKETKKKVPKKIIKKKSPQKKKRIAVKGDIKTVKEIGKNVQVKYRTEGLFGVAKGTISFLKTPVKPVQTEGECSVQVKPIETGEELDCIIGDCIIGDPNCCCLDPVKLKFPDPAQIEKDVFGSKNPKTKIYFCRLCKNKGCKTDLKNIFPSTCQDYFHLSPHTEKWFHGSTHQLKNSLTSSRLLNEKLEEIVDQL